MALPDLPDGLAWHIEKTPGKEAVLVKLMGPANCPFPGYLDVVESRPVSTQGCYDWDEKSKSRFVEAVEDAAHGILEHIARENFLNEMVASAWPQ